MFKPYDQKQNFLIPPSYLDFLGEWHESVILSELLDGLDLEAFLKSYANSERGTSAYHPRMLVKILFFGYMNGIFSSRKLAAKTKTDLAFMFLAWGNQPDFRTIARFRKQKGEILSSVFVQIVRKAKELGLVSFGTVSVDGTKIYADASKSKNSDLDTLEKQMKKLIEEADEIDAIEDREFGEDDDGSWIPEELKTKEGREKKRKEIEEKKRKTETKKEAVKREIGKKAKEGIAMTRINSTDPDSRLMRMKRKDFANGYNPQLATENQFIIATTVGNAASDINELIPVLGAIEKNFQTKPKIVLADKGYSSEKNYEYLQDQGIDGYIPHPKLAQNLEGWKYNERKDAYTDKEGDIYLFKQLSESKKPRDRWCPKLSEQVSESDFRSKIYQTKTKDGKNKFLSVNKAWLEHCRLQDRKLSAKEGKEIYGKRCHSVEPVFGNIKRNLKFERFSLRWFEWVRIEWNLITIAHNLKKILSYHPA